MRLPGRNLTGETSFGMPTRGGGAAAGAAAAIAPSDLAVYRAAVADLLLEVAGQLDPDNAGKAERILADRIVEPEFRSVLAADPDGFASAAQRLLTEVRDFRPSPRRSGADLSTLLRIYLLSRIDTLWWGRIPAYPSDADVLTATDLVDLDALRRGGFIRFRYRRQASTLLTRATRAAERRVWPGRTPRSAGLRFARTRPTAVALLNQLSTEVARRSAGTTPPIWVTSMARSVQHQHRLRALGYPALLPSAHCVGYAVDIEMSWFRRFDVSGRLAALLAERQSAGDVNVIDEGQAWHVCLSPTGVRQLRRDFATAIGG